MNGRNTAVRRAVRSVKMLHMTMMVLFPIVMVLGMPILLGVLSVQSLNTAQPYFFSSTLTAFVYAFWIMYTSFMLTVVRNYYLQQLVSEECDFDAYLECMIYLEKFYVRKKATWGQKVNRTDAYLLKGDFQGAYQNLMGLKPYYESFQIRTKLLYDYFWCKFYAELDDAANYMACTELFCKNWQKAEKLGAAVRAHVDALCQELSFRTMIFTRKNESAKAVLQTMYRSNKIESRYEFFKYCYFMGKVEFAMANYSIAKHWFAQTVSFGLKEHMSARAAGFLQKLDEMQVMYAPVGPADNAMNIHRRSINVFSVFFSIILGFLLVIVFALV